MMNTFCDINEGQWWEGERSTCFETPDLTYRREGAREVLVGEKRLYKDRPGEKQTMKLVSKMGAPAERLQVVGLAEAGFVVKSLELLERVFPSSKGCTL